MKSSELKRRSFADVQPDGGRESCDTFSFGQWLQSRGMQALKTPARTPEAARKGMTHAGKAGERSEAADIARRVTLAALAAAAALATSIVGLTFDLWPGLKPDPEVQLDATMQVADIEPGVPYGSYLTRTRQFGKRRGVPAPVLGVWGNLFYVEMQTRGLKQRKSTLRWHLHDWRTKRRFAQQSTAPEPTVRKSDSTPNDRIIVRVWYQPPVDKGEYFLRFELSARGVLLAIADSPRFPHCADLRCGA